MTAAASQRVFFALWPDAAALDALDVLARSGEAQCGGRHMRRDGLHMTMAFIGPASPHQLTCLEAVAGRVRAAPFTLVLDQLGWWPHNRILWAGCHAVPSCQRRLFAALSRELVAAGFPLDTRAPVPHVTLVRHARCDGLPALERPIAWPVGEFSLVESFLQPSGARYRVLARWPLRETA